MKKFNIENINTPEYWDNHQTALDFGLRQKTYLELAGIGNSIAELGCGLSPMLAHANIFEEKVGVDFSWETIKRAGLLYPDVTYRQADVTETYLPEAHFDVSVSGEVIEHLENPEALIEEMKRITKKGGKIIISTPHLEFEDPEHLWEFDEAWFQERGFTTEVVHSERFPGRSYIFAFCVV